MKAVIDLVTIWTDDAPRMRDFYRDVLGMDVKLDLGGYVEFDQPGVRFSICDRGVMVDVVGIAAFEEKASGQQVELAFPVESPDRVDAVYGEIIAQGAEPIHPPQDMPWSQRTALFADPDGNIHEIFADLEDE